MPRLTFIPAYTMLVSFTATVSLFLFSSLFAVEAQDASNEDETDIEVITITGSRIPRVNAISSSPIISLSNEEIKMSGSLSLLESIYDLPVFGAARDNSNTARSSRNMGSQQMDLRDLGPQRTLVLVNGKRLAPAGVDGIVDTSAIPVALIDRVEIITGGASAVYGSEAIAGVVNIILKDNFDGIEFNAYYGITQEGDGEQFRLNLTTGSDFANDQGYAMVHLDYSDTKGIINKDREISKTTGALVSNPNDTGPNDRLPASIWQSDYGRSTTIPSGRYSIPGVGTRVIDPITGQLRNFSTPADRYRFNEGHLAVPLQTFNAYAIAHYEVVDYAQIFSEMSFSNTQSFRIIEAAGETVSNIPLTNANIPQVVLDAITEGSEPDATELSVRRRFTEFGPRSSNFERNAIRVLLGVKGDISENWQYETYYLYGRYTASNENFGRMRLDHLAATLGPENCDNFNAVQIQSQAAMCPGSIDLFSENSITQEYIDFIAYQDIRTGYSQQQVWAANVNGDIFELPAGYIKLALGIENRQENNNDIPSSIIQAGQSTSNLAPQTQGKFDVNEFYAEAIIPLVDSDITLMKKLELTTSVRLSDFSTVGSLTSWNIGMFWQPSHELRIRIMQAQAHRSPNIDELFRGRNESFNSASDPCNNGGSPGVVADNCAALGIGNDFVQPENRIRNVIAGNTDLSEEQSDTTTLGIIYTPQDNLLQGLSLSIDWFNIEIENAITTPGLQTIMDLCYMSLNLSDPACDLITRADDGEITEVLRGALNTGFITTNGLDIEANYQFDLPDIGIGGYGTIYTRLNYSFLNEYDEESFLGSDVIHKAGTLGLAKHQFVLNFNYTFNDYFFNWKIKYIGEVQVDPNRTDADNGEVIPGRGIEEIEGYKISGKTYSDVAFKYMHNPFVEFSFGITNLFDQKLPLVVLGGRQNTLAGVYDFRGRAFYSGISVLF
ncbi:TonB-dependent receptor plug domain-containing protein [Colwellia sp. TT2012]|uniref:TonB-dependent receptor plug domain-containing protein n=1 Tax=Colwellia sp. TT2012 TaxID=1720342 RepID=UPI0007094DED|nr:TonB-dependent receptor [Colwellia sp. TT2012]